MKNQKGISLIETLLVLGIMVTVMAVISSSFMMVLIRSAKARILKEVEDEGKYALRVMEQKIRNATEIVDNSSGLDCATGMSYLNIRSVDGNTIEYGCYNGGVVSMEDDLILGNEESVSELTTSKVIVSSCIFDCYPGGFEEPDRVDLSFTVGKGDADSRVEEQAQMDFQTTIVLRNF